MNEGSASLIHRLWMHEILLATQRLELADRLAREQLERDPISASTWEDLIDQQIALRNFDEAGFKTTTGKLELYSERLAGLDLDPLPEAGVDLGRQPGLELLAADHHAPDARGG